MANTLAATITESIRHVVGSDPVVALHEPEFGEAEHRFVNECLDSTFVSTVGPFVTKFEEQVAEFTGARHAVAVSNGTSALQVALALAGVERDDEVLIPALSFIATANAAAHLGAVPHFVDSSSRTLGMDADALAAVLETLEQRDGQLVNPGTVRRVAAIAPMHTLGHPVDIHAIVELGSRYGVPVVEDAAESLGSFVGDQHTGTFGLLGVLSFNGNKIVTTGGGGMILTDDPELGRRAKHLTTTAKLPHQWEFEHDEIAWNYRLPNLNAALGVGQLTNLQRNLARKRLIADRYAEVFAGVDGVTFQREPEGTTSNYWLCALRIDGGDKALRDEILGAANDAGLRCRPFWNLLNRQRMYRDYAHGDLSVAEQLIDQVICMPSSPKLGV